MCKMDTLSFLVFVNIQYCIAKFIMVGKIKVQIQQASWQYSTKQIRTVFHETWILGDIHKICISGKIFAFHKSTKDILEHLLI